MPSTPYRYIVLNEAGQAMIEGTRYKVRMLVLDHVIHGWSAEEMKWQHAGLTLSQIYSALAYYYDHETQMNEETAAEQDEVAALRAQFPPSPLQARVARLKGHPDARTASRFVEQHSPDLVTAKTPEEFEELRVWANKLPSERAGPPPHTAPWPKREPGAPLVPLPPNTDKD
ncbi:MAG TPA: DUF433 domain-containing protein [Candidatus Xenobia bacterium]